MRRGFALPSVIALLVIFTLVTFHLMNLHLATGEVERAWHDLDQAQLNTASGTNHFLTTQEGFGPNGHGQFEFEPQNGFDYKALPLGLFWILESHGKAHSAEVRTRTIHGGLGQSQHLLQMAKAMKDLVVSDDVRIEGDVRFGTGDLLPNNHPLREQSSVGSVVTCKKAGLAAHLAGPFSDAWEAQMKVMFPQAVWLTGDNVVNLSELPSGDPLTIVKGRTMSLGGTFDENYPLIVLAQGDIAAPQGLNGRNLWLIAQGSIRVERQTQGSQLHFLGRRIDLLGSLDVQRSTLSAVAWASQSQGQATIRLSGRGSFSGSLVALATSGELARELGWERDGPAAIFKDKTIDTHGFIYCEGTLSLRGVHRGAIVAHQWNYQQGSASFPGRMDDVVLSAGEETLGVWGMEGHRGEEVYSWGVDGEP